MKKPKMSDLEYDRKGTKKVRSLMAHASKIKITINIDEDTLKSLRKMSDSTGIPYQTLLNKILKESVNQKRSEESRLTHLEKEVALLRHVLLKRT